MKLVMMLLSLCMGSLLSASTADTIVQCSHFSEPFITEQLAIDHISQQSIRLIEDFDSCETSQLQNDGFDTIDNNDNTLFVSSEIITNACTPHTSNGTAITTIPGRETEFDATSIFAIHVDVQLQQAGSIDEIFLDYFGPSLISQSTSTDIAFVMTDLMTGIQIDTQYLEVIPGQWQESNMISFDHNQIQSTYWRIDMIPYGMTNPAVAAQHQWLKLDNIGITATSNNYCQPIIYGGSERIAHIPTCGDAGYYKYKLRYLDACKTWIEKTYLVEVIDSIAPQIVCPAHITVSANTACSYLWMVYADVYDECSQVSVYAEYIAQDLQHPLGTMIELGHGIHDILYTALDECNNTSTCHTIVTVIDDTPPTAICDEVAISLTDDGTAKLYATSIDQGSHDNYCGAVQLQISKMMDLCTTEQDQLFADCVTYCCEETQAPQMVILRVTDEYGNTNECMAQVSVQNKIPPRITCPDDITVSCNEFEIDTPWGSPVVIDNCEPIKISKTLDQSELHRCGDTGWYGEMIIRWSIDATHISCTQTITVLADLPTIHDISWPQDYVHQGCIQDVSELYPDLLPLGYGNPIFDNITCQKYVSSYQDAEVYFGPQGPGTGVCKKYIRTWTVISWCGYSSFEHKQVLKILDNNPPRFGSTPRDTVLCSYDTNCLGVDNIENIVSYIIDDDCGGIAISYIIDGKLYDDTTFPRWWDIGSTSVTVVATDHCHNTSSAEFVVHVQDCKSPQVYCQNISTSLNKHLEVELWASDIASAQDNCSPAQELRYSFSEDIYDSVITFDCDDVGYNIVSVYVWDDEQNYSACDATIRITDNTSSCPDVGARGVAQGTIQTIDGVPISNVILQITSGMSMCLDGAYTMSLESTDDGIRASKRDDYLYGVSTFDLILMQKHILGEEVFEHWWQYIAADINNDGAVTAIDLIQLRKLILGITDTLPHNDSYQFFELGSQQTHIAMLDPHSENEVHFVGIKIGDVNLSGASLDTNKYEISDLHKQVDKIHIAVEIDGQSQNTGENDSLASKNHQDTPTATVETNQKTGEYTLQVYPNPVMNTLQVRLDGEFLYQVCDSQGKVLIEKVATNSASIDVQSLISSIYFLRIIYREHIITKSFIKI